MLVDEDGEARSYVGGGRCLCAWLSLDILLALAMQDETVEIICGTLRFLSLKRAMHELHLLSQWYSNLPWKQVRPSSGGTQSCTPTRTIAKPCSQASRTHEPIRTGSPDSTLIFQKP